MAASVDAISLVWDKEAFSNSPNPADLDPNFLRFSEFKSSPWHQALRTLKYRMLGFEKDSGSFVMPPFPVDSMLQQMGNDLRPMRPCLLVDVHGKRDRPGDMMVDVGLRPLEVLWAGTGSSRATTLVDELREFLKLHLTEAFAGTGYGVDCNPRLCGFWGSTADVDTHTITHQAVLLSIPAVQLEISRSLRKRMSEDANLTKAVGRVFLTALDKVIRPQWDIQSSMSAYLPDAKDSQARPVTDSLAPELRAKLAEQSKVQGLPSHL